MNAGLQSWLTRTCCCRHPDPHICEELRYGERGAEENDYEGCDCVCHRELAEEEE
jgi:hypothetical protein